MTQDSASVLRFTPRPPKGERRGYPRYPLPQIVVTFHGADHEVINWSRGGFLVTDRHPDCPIATTAEGFLSIRGRNGRYPFQAELLRRDERSGQIAFRFVEPSRSLMEALASITECRLPRGEAAPASSSDPAERGLAPCRSRPVAKTGG